MPMKISPEPLHPLRNWRELWHANPTSGRPALQERGSFHDAQWKQPKRASFDWLNHLMSRETER